MLRALLWTAIALSVASNLATAAFLYQILDHQDRSIYVYGGSIHVDNDTPIHVKVVNDSSDAVPVDVQNRTPIDVQVRDVPPVSVEIAR